MNTPPSLLTSLVLQSELLYFFVIRRIPLHPPLPVIFLQDCVRLRDQLHPSLPRSSRETCLPVRAVLPLRLVVSSCILSSLSSFRSWFVNCPLLRTGPPRPCSVVVGEATFNLLFPVDALRRPVLPEIRCHRRLSVALPFPPRAARPTPYADRPPVRPWPSIGCLPVSPPPVSPPCEYPVVLRGCHFLLSIMD